MKTYFEKPKQVVFADPDNPGEWLVGIAYGDDIICACCGGVFSIEEVIELAAEDGVANAIYPYEDWVDIAIEIAGDGLPGGLDIVEGKIVEVKNNDSEDAGASDYEAYYFQNLE